MPDALAANAWALQPPASHERRDVLRGDAALLVDGLLVRVARGRGAIDVAIGDALATLAQGDRVLRLGFSGLGDYARERLAIAASTAKAMARLARELRFRPLLAEAVRRGEVSARKAQTILAVALGEDEARWVERARTATVRELEAEVRAARDGAAVSEPDDTWNDVSVFLTPSQREVVDVALELAGKVIGPAAPRWERLEAMLQEALAQRPVEVRDDEEPAVLQCAVNDWLALAKEALEQETKRWEVLERAEDVVAPDSDVGTDPFAIDGRLRELSALRSEWDATLGHLALLLKTLGLWRDMGFASFDHYCAERLGMAARTVEQRVALERKLHAHPALRQALSSGRVSYEQARVIARTATERTIDEWISRAEQTTCIDLMRSAEADAEAQMCRRAELLLQMPARVSVLLTAACRAVREAVGRWLTPGQCLELIAHHFIASWEHVARRRQTLSARVRERDDDHCQVPGCSRAAAHAHHVVFRSQCGGDQFENLVGLCAAHHLHGVHAGFVHAHGEAPDQLTWELGVRPGMAPLMVVRSRATFVERSGRGHRGPGRGRPDVGRRTDPSARTSVRGREPERARAGGRPRVRHRRFARGDLEPGEPCPAGARAADRAGRHAAGQHRRQRRPRLRGAVVGPRERHPRPRHLRPGGSGGPGHLPRHRLRRRHVGDPRPRRGEREALRGGHGAGHPRLRRVEPRRAHEGRADRGRRHLVGPARR